MIKIVLGLCLTSFLILNLNACDYHEGDGLVPKGFQLPVSFESLNSVTREDVDILMEEVENLYRSEVADRGSTFRIFANYDDDDFNAYASRAEVPGEYTIWLQGGLVFHDGFDLDAIAMVLCHEVGHHLGGAPRKFRKFGYGPDDYPSNEGQSDFFASSKCFKDLYSSVDNEVEIDEEVFSPRVLDQCGEVYGINSKEFFLCLRSSTASQKVARALNSNRPVYFDKPDTVVVASTNNGHPRAQCRLDTYFAGSLCDKDEVLSDIDPHFGTCSRQSGDNQGVRPLCWFRP